MKWLDYQKDFSHFLKLEISLSDNSIEAYSADIKKLVQYLQYKNLSVGPEEITSENYLKDFIAWIMSGYECQVQARLIRV